ncbi:MAG: hypothetical protein PHR82_00540 [Endomicrobiaceae bacterium]|nr:hypothetical protein [Endomicrobiaceae bacterium]
MLENNVLPAINFLDDINPTLAQKMPGAPLPQDSSSFKKYFLLTTSIKSINNSDLLFTNFLSSDQCKEYALLKTLRDKFSKVPDALDSLFHSTEQEHSNQKKNDRLYNIFIKTGINKRILKNKDILKYKFQQEKDTNVPLRIYALCHKNKIFVMLIDLYHMAWISPHPQTKKEDPIGLYNAHKKHSYCISNIRI